MPTPEETRREIEALRRRADQMEAEARRQEFVAAQMRRIAAEAEKAGIATLDLAEVERAIEALLLRGLPSPAENATIATMNARTNAEGRVFRGRPIENAHPMPQRARELKKSAEKVSVELSKRFKRPIPRSTVQSWYAESDEARRPIPRDIAEYLAKAPWSIPITTWKHLRD